MTIISTVMIKDLREKTGAGMMECKKALTECDGDFEKAIDLLRQKGLASAFKKAGRITSEGLIYSYIHMGKIGAMVEVNCETDFVARTEDFKELVKDIAMQMKCRRISLNMKERFTGHKLRTNHLILLKKS
jgi:elongation factor Ts